jgi:hypothetical protein
LEIYTLVGSDGPVVLATKVHGWLAFFFFFFFFNTTKTLRSFELRVYSFCAAEYSAISRKKRSCIQGDFSHAAAAYNLQKGCSIPGTEYQAIECLNRYVCSQWMRIGSYLVQGTHRAYYPPSFRAQPLMLAWKRYQPLPVQNGRTWGWKRTAGPSLHSPVGD